MSGIRAQNVQAAVGRVGARPISNEQQLQLNIKTQGRLSSVAEFENIVVRTNRDGSVLRLSDVARVELGAAKLDRETRLNGGPASAVAIYQTPGANAIATLKQVRDRVAEAQKRFPEDLAWKVTYDPTSFVTATIEEVKKTLVEAFILVVLVVFLFLGSVRATLIPTLAVPVSLIGTFIALKPIGYSANSVSLLALVLAIGLVMRSLDSARASSGAGVARIVRFSIIGLVLVGVAGFGVVGLSKITPTGFLPEDDQGALFVVVQMPGGTSVARTSEAIRQAEDIVREEAAVADFKSVI